MRKKQDAASVKAEVEKQTAAIRRLATSLRAEASSGNWLANFSGRKDVLLGTAQTLDGIADSLTFAVNNDTSALPRLNKAFRSAAGGLLFLVGGAAGTIANETVKELDIPEAIADAFTDADTATTAVERAMAEVDAAGSTASTPTDANIPTDADIPSDGLPAPAWRSQQFEIEVQDMLDNCAVVELEDALEEPRLIEIAPARELGNPTDPFRVDADHSAYYLVLRGSGAGLDPAQPWAGEVHRSEEIVFDGQLTPADQAEMKEFIEQRIEAEIEVHQDQEAEARYIEDQIDERRGK